jgi:hypothetical protein
MLSRDCCEDTMSELRDCAGEHAVDCASALLCSATQRADTHLGTTHCATVEKQSCGCVLF